MLGSASKIIVFTCVKSRHARVVLIYATALFSRHTARIDVCLPWTSSGDVTGRRTSNARSVNTVHIVAYRARRGCGTNHTKPIHLDKNKSEAKLHNRFLHLVHPPPLDGKLDFWSTEATSQLSEFFSRDKALIFS
jgi:hypothetical protein